MPQPKDQEPNLPAEKSLMLLHLQDISILTEFARTARLQSSETTWTEAGEVRFSLRVEIESETSRTQLRELGLEGQALEVQFREVQRAQISVMGLDPRKALIESWEIIRYPVLGGSVLHSDAGSAPGGLSQHKIVGAGGATLDVVCGQVWLMDVYASRE